MLRATTTKSDERSKTRFGKVGKANYLFVGRIVIQPPRPEATGFRTARANS